MSLFKLFKRKQRGKRQLERKGPASKKRRQAEPKTKPTKRPWLRRSVPALTLFVVWVLTSFTILYRTPRNTLDLGRGQKAPSSIGAQVNFDFVDQAETSEARRQEVNKVLDHYRLNYEANDLTLRRFRQLFEILQPKADPDDSTLATAPDKVEQVVQSLSSEQRNALRLLFDNQDKQDFLLKALREALLARGIISPKKQWLNERPERIQIIDDADRKRIAEARELMTPEQAARELVDQLEERFQVGIGASMRDTLVNEVLAVLINPNLTFDNDMRVEAEQRAGERVAPVKRKVKKGTIFIEKGQTITEQDILKMKAHAAALEASTDIRQEALNDLSLLLLNLFIVLTGAAFLYHSTPRESTRLSNVVMIGIIVCINVLLTWGTLELLLWLMAGAPALMNPALPLSLGAMLLALLLGKRVGLIAAVFIPALCALAGDDAMHIFLLGMISSVVGVMAIYKSRNRIRTFRAALWISLTAFLIESTYLFVYATPWPFYLYALGIIVISAFATVLLVNVLLPLFEYSFRLTTDISLLELSDLNHPLLKRLQLEAPGTYHHTLMVATLAEHAAEAVGANTLLTRVAAYFHDIGKLANPSYFTENSFGQNRHEELSPRMSSMVILNHVKEGLAMAAKYKLKEPIREAIATHHGTSLVYYFYRRALDSNQISDASDEEQYRYPGPAPQSREASIISIADTCEAASRSLEKPTPQKIDALVTELFHNKLLTGQLDQSELTMAELNIVIETIKKTLQTMLHGRVAYPKFTETDGGESTRRMATRRPKQSGAGDDAGGDTRRLDRSELEETVTDGEPLEPFDEDDIDDDVPDDDNPDDDDERDVATETEAEAGARPQPRD